MFFLKISHIYFFITFFKTMDVRNKAKKNSNPAHEISFISEQKNLFKFSGYLKLT
jgi:hypothetical protein